jgi:V/A-type H+-transporting ATPase subunit I
MSWRERLQPVPMQRVALVAPAEVLRAMLVRVAGAGTVELDEPAVRDQQQGTATGGARAGPPTAAAVLCPGTPDRETWERAGRRDLLAGEAELEQRARNAVARGSVAALAGWTPTSAAQELAGRLGEVGGAVVPLARPRGVDAPTLLRSDGLRRSLTPLVETYGTVPSADLDPTVLVAITYLLMFGMMFGDVGHGAMLLLLAAALYAGWPRRLARVRRAWPLVAGAAVSSILFGFLYGECFGPTGLVPVLWLAPLDDPVSLLLAGVGVGGVLLAGAYALGTVNRWREGGWPLLLYAPSGLAGTTLFLGLGLAAGGWYFDLPALATAAAVAVTTGLVLAFTGFLAAAGGGAGGGAQAAVELFDLVVRLGSNVVSFARLAAFGLTHAALGAAVWDATSGLWHRGGAAAAAAVLVLVVGNALAFTLEAVVAGVQALRLEYYELFSRVFLGQGRPFRPWRLPISSEEDLPCRSG